MLRLVPLCASLEQKNVHHIQNVVRVTWLSYHSRQCLALINFHHIDNDSIISVHDPSADVRTFMFRSKFFLMSSPVYPHLCGGYGGVCFCEVRAPQRKGRMDNIKFLQPKTTPGCFTSTTTKQCIGTATDRPAITTVVEHSQNFWKAARGIGLADSSDPDE